MILFITSLGTIIHKKLSVRLLNHTNTLSQLTKCKWAKIRHYYSLTLKLFKKPQTDQMTLKIHIHTKFHVHGTIFYQSIRKTQNRKKGLQTKKSPLALGLNFQDMTD